MASPTFSEAYCAQHAVASADFVRVVFWRTLYGHARLVAPLFRLLDSNYFAADMDLIRGAGEVRRMRDFQDEVLDFTHHPANRGFWRIQLRLRVSTTRLRLLMKATLPRSDEGGSRSTVGSASPMEVPAAHRVARVGRDETS